MRLPTRHTGLLFLFCSVFVLAACAPEVINAPPASQPAPSTRIMEATATAAVSGGDTIESMLKNTPKHISKTLDDNFSVEADVYVPNVKQADILLAKNKSYDEQALVTMFFADKKPSRTVSGDGAVTYEDAGAGLVLSDYIYYWVNDFDYYHYPTENFISKRESIGSGMPLLGEVYTQERLDFASREEAVQQAREIFRQLSIETADDVEIYAIDHGTMQEQQDARLQIDKENAKKYGFTGDITEGYKIKQTFSPDDDFYMMHFTMKQNNIPVTQQSYGLEGERGGGGSTASVSISKKGLLSFSVQNIFEQQGVAESPAKLITVDDAIRIAHEEDAAVISTPKTTVSEIRFEYVSAAYNNNFNEVKLIPCWSLTEKRLIKNDKPTKDGKKREDVTMASMIFINAVTGEVLK